MPVTVNTPFGQRVQSDPRDAVAQRNFAIMQGLAQLQGGRDIAQIEANARMRAAEQDAAQSQTWAELQQRMQADKLAQERAMFEQRLGAEDQRYTRGIGREDELYERKRAEETEDPVYQIKRQLAERHLGALESMPSSSTADMVVDPLTGELMQRPIPTPDYEAAIAGTDTKPFGPVFEGPNKWMDVQAAANPLFAPFVLGRAAGNMMFGSEPDLEPLRRAYDVVRRQLERDRFKPEDAHIEAINTLRRNGITPEMIKAAGLDEAR